jgi:hypothetical protein
MGWGLKFRAKQRTVDNRFKDSCCMDTKDFTLHLHPCFSFASFWGFKGYIGFKLDLL